MGTWGPGIYSGDFASDLRAAVAAASRLPLEPDRIVQLLCELEPDAAHIRDDEEHTVFWLVVADQLDKRGIRSTVATREAKAIIETGADSQRMSELGMASAILRKRAQILGELFSRLRNDAPSGRRSSVLREPQPFLFAVGECWSYPTFQMGPINPYFSSPKIKEKYAKLDGWGGMVVTAKGRAFGYLAWYQLATAEIVFAEKPSLENLFGENFVGRFAGTCPPLHLKKLRLQKVGDVTLNSAKVRELYLPQQLERYDRTAISDISIANSLTVQSGSQRTKTLLEILA